MGDKSELDPQVEHFTEQIIEIMKETSQEHGLSPENGGSSCTKKLYETFRSKLWEKLPAMLSGRGLKRTSSGTIKTGDGHVISEDFTSDLSPIIQRQALDLSKGDQDTSFKKSDILGDLMDDGPNLKLTPNAKSTPIQIKLKKGENNLTPSQPGFAMPAPKKRSVQRPSAYCTPDAGVELNLLDSMTDSIEISDYDSDDEGRESESLAPSWARRGKIIELVAKQEKTDPDTIFGRVMGGSMFDLAKVFEGWTPNLEKYNKRRTMSGNWTLDQLDLDEEEAYREKMNYLKVPSANSSFEKDADEDDDNLII